MSLLSLHNLRGEIINDNKWVYLKIMLSKRGESRHPCLVPNLRGNPFSFSPLSMMLTVGLSYMAFITLR